MTILPSFFYSLFLKTLFFKKIIIYVTILVEIEELYNIEFDIEKLDIKSWKSVNDLIKEVEKMCNEKIQN